MSAQHDAHEAHEGPPGDVPVVPLEEARRAVTAARERLAAAAAQLDSGGADAHQRAHDEASQSTRDVARALWYLRRARREGSGGASGRTG
jgi:hypothetical protein